MHSLLTDAELQQEFLQGLKQRALDQKILYTGEGAKIYYDMVNEQLKDMEPKNIGGGIRKVYDSKQLYSPITFRRDHFLSEFMKTRPYRNYPSCLISLGCGDARQEKILLEELEVSHPHVQYIGVDSSKESLALAEQNLQNITLSKTFLQADFSHKRCSHEIDQLTKGTDIRIFSLLGSTFGNPNQTEIVTNLYNMMGESDLLRFDVATRDVITYENTAKLVNEYRAMLTQPAIQKRNLRILEKYGLQIEADGQLELAVGQEEEVGATLLKYYYLFKKNTTLTVAGEKIHFLAGDRVTLLHVRNYNASKFLTFMEQMGFVLFDTKKQNDTSESTISQFLFAKK